MVRTRQARRSRAAAFVVAATAAGLALSGCSFGQLQLHTLADAAAQSAARISLAAGATDAAGQISPDKPLVVTVAAGRLTDVQVTGPDGPLKGTVSADASTWTSEVDTLEYGASYQVTAGAVDRVGTPATITDSIQTLQPARFLTVASVAPTGNVGVGIPMKLVLSRSVNGEKARERVEQRLVVKANGKTIDDGAWRWDNGTQLRFRPPHYWPGNSTITLDANLKGLKVTKKVCGADRHGQQVDDRTGDDLVRQPADPPDEGDEGRQDHPDHPDRCRQARLRHPLGHQGDPAEAPQPPHGRGERWDPAGLARVLQPRREVRDARDLER